MGSELVGSFLEIQKSLVKPTIHVYMSGKILSHLEGDSQQQDRRPQIYPPGWFHFSHDLNKLLRWTIERVCVDKRC